MLNNESDDKDKVEDEYIEKIAMYIKDREMEAPVILLLHTFKPFALITGELASFFLAPFLILLDDKGFNFIDHFKKTRNIEKLIKRLEDKPNDE